jgi:serine/threonine protein kinase
LPGKKRKNLNPETKLK